jgi:hypothetical protein
MNAKEQLDEISKYVRLWLTDRTPSLEAMSLISDNLVEMAEELKRLKQERLDQLAQTGPKVHGTFGDLTFILFRQGREKFIRIGPDHHVSIKHTTKDEVREHYKLTDPPDNDGKTYMLHFGPFAWGPSEFAVQVSSWEADIIGRQLAELHREEDELEPY